MQFISGQEPIIYSRDELFRLKGITRPSCGLFNLNNEPKACEHCRLQLTYTKVEQVRACRERFPLAKDKGIKALLINARSLVKHNVELADLITSHEIDLAFIT